MHLAGGGLPFCGQDPRQRGLAGAVAADQADFVACGDLKRGRFKQQPRPSAQLDITSGNHQKLAP